MYSLWFALPIFVTSTLENKLYKQQTRKCGEVGSNLELIKGEREDYVCVVHLQMPRSISDTYFTDKDLRIILTLYSFGDISHFSRIALKMFYRNANIPTVLLHDCCGFQ